MRRFSLLSVLVVAVAACSGGSAPTGITTPPPDTTKVPPPPVAVLDSLRRGFYDQNNVLHLYPDTMNITPPFVGAVGSFELSGFVAFTSVGIITDAASIQGFFGVFAVASDNPAIVAPHGTCTGGDGSPCLTLMGARGNATVTVSLGGKSLGTVVAVH
jgi:hypothetical protein